MSISFSHLCINPNEVDMLLYHGDCVDGFASAFACYYYMKTQNKKKKVTFIACQHQKPPPNVNGKNVLICDFSYKYDILKNMIMNANKLAILDHHVSAEKDLKNIPMKHKVFDKSHSGAYITWAYFFGENNIPLFIRYVEDNDIWAKRMPNTKAFTSFIFSVPKSFDIYQKFLDDEYVTNTVIQMGEGMQKQNDSYINDGVKKAAVNFMLIDNKLYFVADVNTSILKSEIGNAIFNTYPNINFAICHSKNSFTGENYLSLRSTDTASDVEVIASKFGGGGHRNAAGLSVFSSDSIPGILLDRYQCYNIIQRIRIKTHQLIDGETEVNVAYLNTTQHKRHLGAYLLQTRYIETIDNESRDISEACNIIRNKIKDASYYIGLDLACIYYYDDSEDNTYFSVISDNIDLLNAMKDMYISYVVDTDDTNISKRLKLKFAGMLTRLI
jgi:oligoribonuclease NrnB/cAMP/cGMP phosphodiesterase (DHH superfamily)